MLHATKNPTDSQILGIITRSKVKTASWIKDLSSGDSYYWEAEGPMHKQMADSLNISDFDEGLAIDGDDID